MQYHAIPYITMQHHAIPCNTMQYHASLITADGAYHCPMGSIRPFLDSLTSYQVAFFFDLRVSDFGATPTLLNLIVSSITNTLEVLQELYL